MALLHERLHAGRALATPFHAATRFSRSATALAIEHLAPPDAFNSKAFCGARRCQHGRPRRLRHRRSRSVRGTTLNLGPPHAASPAPASAVLETRRKRFAPTTSGRGYRGAAVDSTGASRRAFWPAIPLGARSTSLVALLLEKSLSPVDALSQAQLKRRILRPSHNVLRDGGANNFGDRQVLHRRNRLQGVSLIFRQSNRHCFGGLHGLII